MVKSYLVVSYAYLVKVGKYVLEATGSEDEMVVQDDYKEPVALYITEHYAN